MLMKLIDAISSALDSPSAVLHISLALFRGIIETDPLDGRTRSMDHDALLGLLAVHASAEPYVCDDHVLPATKAFKDFGIVSAERKMRAVPNRVLLVTVENSVGAVLPAQFGQSV